MELKQFSHRELKAINNGQPTAETVEKLPGFAGGGIGANVAGSVANMYGGWQKATQYNPGAYKPLTMPTMKQADFSGANAGVQKMMTATPNIPTQNVDPKQRAKFVSNGGPTQSDSAAAGISPYFALGAWAGGGILEGINRIKSADEHLADAGTSEQNINGITYTQQNGVDEGQIMQEYDQTTGKDFLTNPFRGFASIFGRGKAKREAENAARYASIQQWAARDNAYAQYLKLDGAKRYGNMEDQALYAANGKLPKLRDGLVSAVGKVNGEATARVSNGEVIANKWLGTMYRVPGIKNNKDGKLASLNDSDTVITNKYGLSDYAWRTGDITGAERMMQMLTKPNYKCGKLPRHAEGWLGNLIPTAIGSLASIDQIYEAYKNKPYRPNTYASNPYENEALSTLAGLRMNPYPIITQLRDAEYRQNRAIDIAGGLSGSQRNAIRMANLNTTQKNIANLLSSIQQQNNAYRSNYAQTAINAGQASRTARMDANRWDLDYYSKAHAARNKGIQTGIANMLAQAQQYQANEFKRNQFNRTMSLYEADQKQRKDQLNWYKDNAAKLANMGTMFNIPSLYGNRPLFYQDENGNYVRI